MSPRAQNWIAVDWGTSRLRAYRMEGARVLEEAASEDGMGRLAPNAFEPALLALIEGWVQDVTRVVVCGMAGARAGWHEAPYVAVPARPADLRPVPVPTHDARLRVTIAPGLKQVAPRADVMRGEETQIAGFLSLNQGFDGVVCLPGTHAKWAQISADEVVSFQTFMTGEMFALLGSASVLKASVAPSGWDDAAFLEALARTLSRPETLASDLFTLRADDLLHGSAPETARARLAGLLIGAEIAAAKPYWLGQQVALIGENALCGHYASALGAQGVPTSTHAADAMTIAGLHSQLLDTAP